MNLVRDQLAGLITQAIVNAQNDGALPPLDLPEALVERPQNAGHGDYASTVALKLARPARANPRQIASVLVERLPQSALLENVEIGGAGFINLYLSPAWLASQVDEIVTKGADFGQLALGDGKRVQIEFVSANPTGPLHAGSGRGAALGDTLANLLNKAGYYCEREYYVNDAGARLIAFYLSVYARYLNELCQPASVPSDGYQGAYIKEVAEAIVAEHGDRFARQSVGGLFNQPAGSGDLWQALSPQAQEEINTIGQLGIERMLAAAHRDMETLGVRFDHWFSEQTLFSSGMAEQTLAHLRQKGQVALRDGATWFQWDGGEEDRENVLIRNTGVATYFMSDIAYHWDKFRSRRFDQVIDIWGADHHGHVPRMKAAMRAIDVEPERLTLLLHQLVTLKRGQEIVRMSKRTGEIVTLQEVLEEVGRDACRFFFLARSADSQMDFDLELAKQQSAENPVYYVQYAHARIASILRLAQQQGLAADGDVSLIGEPTELALIRQMLQLPELVADTAARLEPHHLPHYAQELARAFHLFYQNCRVISPEDEPLSRSRLKLIEAARIVLSETLRLMGVSAPEQM